MTDFLAGNQYIVSYSRNTPQAAQYLVLLAGRFFVNRCRIVALLFLGLFFRRFEPVRQILQRWFPDPGRG